MYDGHIEKEGFIFIERSKVYMGKGVSWCNVRIENTCRLDQAGIVNKANTCV